MMSGLQFTSPQSTGLSGLREILDLITHLCALLADNTLVFVKCHHGSNDPHTPQTLQTDCTDEVPFLHCKYFWNPYSISKMQYGMMWAPFFDSW